LKGGGGQKDWQEVLLSEIHVSSGERYFGSRNHRVTNSVGGGGGERPKESINVEKKSPKQGEGPA